MRKFRPISLVIAGMIAVAGAGQASAALVGNSISTGIAALKEWNVVAFNNLDTAHHIEGRIFVGNNLNATYNFEAQAKSTIPTSNYGTPLITVGGNASFNANNTKIEGTGSQVLVGKTVTGKIEGRNGTVQSGQGNSATIVNSSMTVQQNKGTDFTNTLTSQAADIKNSLQSLSQNLKALTTTSGVSVGGDSNNQKINVTGTGLQVLNWTEAMFEGASDNQQLEITIPSGATLVVNVAGTDIDFNRNFNTFSNMQNVLFNFYEATTVDIGRQFSGSILAAYATVTAGNSGNVDGTIIGNNVVQNGNGEIHNAYFQGDLSSLSGGGSSPVVAPEPSTWAMLILGFGLVGFAMRARGRRTLVVQAA
jgi:choice-of-anchor A domain-containing protein